MFLFQLRNEVPATHATFRTVPLASVATPTNTSCVISGWGHLTDNGVSPNNLQMAYVLLYDRNRCLSSYGTLLQPNTICAGVYGGGIDSCQVS